MKLDLTWKQFRFTLSISNVVTSATFLIPLSYAVDCSRFSGHVDHLNPIQSHFTGQMLLHCSAVFIWILFLWLCRSRWPPWPSSIALFTALIRSSLRNSVNFYQWLTTNNNPQHHLYNIDIVLLPATNNRLLLLLLYHDKLPLMVSVISKLTNFIDCVWKIEMGPTVSLKMSLKSDKLHSRFKVSDFPDSIQRMPSGIQVHAELKPLQWVPLISGLEPTKRFSIKYTCYSPSNWWTINQTADRNEAVEWTDRVESTIGLITSNRPGM